MASNLAIDPPQQQLNWCWAAVAQTVAHYFFPLTPLTQCRIASKYLNQGNSCCEDGSGDACDQVADLNAVLDKLNESLHPKMHKTAYARALTFDEVRAAIDSAAPICVRIEWSGGGGHFVMITGYSISGTEPRFWLDVSDPFFPDTVLPFDFFSSQYYSVGHWTHSYVMAVPAPIADQE